MAARPGNIPRTIQVQASIAKSELIQNNLFATGTVIANEEVQLVMESSGKIVYLNINEGKEVQKGSLICKINNQELQAQMNKLKAEERLAIDKEARNKKLLEMNGISKDEYESSLNALQLIQADIEIIKTQLSKMELHAPFNGILGLKMVSVGAYVTPSTIITSLHQSDPVKIDFSIPERYSKQVKSGMSISFKSESSAKKLEAKIIAIESKIDESTRNLSYRASCPNKQHLLIPGSFVKVEIKMVEPDSSIMIPSEALVPILKGYKVFIYKSGIATELKVQTGLRTETQVQITDGLHSGDTVITSGMMQIKAGSSIQISTLTGHE